MHAPAHCLGRTRLASACCWHRNTCCLHALAETRVGRSDAAPAPLPVPAGRATVAGPRAGSLAIEGQVRSGGRVVLVLGDTCGTKQIRGRHLGAWLGCLPAGRPVAFAPPCVCVCLSVSLLLLVCSSAVQDDEEGHAINWHWLA